MKLNQYELKRFKKEKMEEIDRWLDNEYGMSYTKLEELHDYFFEKYTDQKEEIERLNNIIDKKEQFLVDNIKRLEREVVKRDNIINELEKWLEEQHQFIIEIPAFTKEISTENKTMEICYENVLDKLQELKGSDKE